MTKDKIKKNCLYFLIGYLAISAVLLWFGFDIRYEILYAVFGDISYFDEYSAVSICLRIFGFPILCDYGILSPVPFLRIRAILRVVLSIFASFFLKEENRREKIRKFGRILIKILIVYLVVSSVVILFNIDWQQFSSESAHHPEISSPGFNSGQNSINVIFGLPPSAWTPAKGVPPTYLIQVVIKLALALSLYMTDF